MIEIYPHRAFVALGSNLSDPASQVQRAFDALAGLPGARLVARSSLYRTAPVGYADQPDFINAVALIETQLSAHDLLDALLDIEHRFGRVREFRNAPRVLDLDLLLYDDLMHHEHGLTVPHPRMHERGFVLAPLVEIAPDIIIPGHGLGRDWLSRCMNQGVERIAA
jgi:2-amino-4-hydroxy-6-hydroxymethyldihydropteridine diphosphokinase